MPSYGLLTTSEDGRCAKFFATPLIIILIIIMMMTMNRMTKKAALGGPSSDETFPLSEKTKSYVLLLAAASYPA